jgi:hypothetical protein
MSTLSHEEVMKKVCACGHLMEDHAWTADDAYCMMSSCLCHDFYKTDYEDFRESMLYLLRIGDCV